MTAKYLQLTPTQVESALQHLIPLQAKPESKSPIPATSWNCISQLVDTMTPTLDLRASDRDVHEWITIALARAEDWIAAHDVKDAVKVYGLCEEIRRNPDATPFFGELHEIANNLQEAEAAWSQAWKDFDKMEGAAGHEFLKKATGVFNDKIAAYVPEIARITSNSENSINAFAPKDPLDVWFTGTLHSGPVKFLHNLSTHQSFNVGYWDAHEKIAAKAIFLSRVKAQSPASVDQAVLAIQRGQVPHLAQKDADIARSGDYDFSPFESALRQAEVLSQYDSQFKGRLSTTKPIAFVVHGKDEKATPEVFFWPANMARNHIERITAVEADAPADTVECPRG